jgi:hypothetical protein
MNLNRSFHKEIFQNFQRNNKKAQTRLFELFSCGDSTTIQDQVEPHFKTSN